MAQTRERLIEELKGEDCYAICTEVMPAESAGERLVRLGTDNRWIRVNVAQLALTDRAQIATEVCFDTVKNGMVRVCPYLPFDFKEGSPSPDASVRYVPLDSIVRKSDVIKVRYRK